jgi:ABC-type transport system substrate-binding protein
MYAPIEGADGKGYATDGPLAVEALDRYTVRFTLAYPFAEFPDALGALAFLVWPADHLEQVGLEAYGKHPVGTGPYMFGRDATRSSVDLVRNPQWWDTSGGPYLDAIHFEVFNSVGAMWLAFQKGEIDWSSVPEGEIAASRSLPQVESGEWSSVDSPVFALGYLLVNMNDPVVGGDGGLALRQALCYGCDPQAVVDAATDGVHQPATSLVPPGVPGWDDVLLPYGHDPGKAAELAAQADPPALELWYPIESLGQKTAETLAASFAECGIEVRVRGLEWDEYVERTLGGEGQLFVLGWAADYPSIDSFLYPLFESSQSGATMGAFYSNEEVDRLLAEARATVDPQARRQIYAEAERLILADAPVVPVFVFAGHRLFSERVANVRFNGMDLVALWRAWVR